VPAKQPKAKAHIHYHKDGTIWAKGQMIDGVMAGYWEWFRKDGTIMRSGYFDDGEQVGEWTTYDKTGRVVKVTTMKPKSKEAPRPSTKRPAAKRTRR
jgi:antitoxin component YwqK of YwqJK toxin-antitoxin module